ncbi:MAG: redoxin family protein [Rhizobiaceae bacterium]|nr:redoxin family protein [Rhizobiaceae bacterium]
MSEGNSPKTDETNGKRSNTLKMAVLAGVLGLAVGAALYAFSGQIGNGGNGGEGGEGDVGPLASAACAVDEKLRTALDAKAGGHLAAFKALDRPISVGELAFDDENGKTRNLTEWQGKTVLFNLWATWCAPCRAEMPALDGLQKDLGGDRFEVVPVSVDLGSPHKPKKFYRDIGMKNAGFFHDGDLATLNVLKKAGLAFGLPATLLVSDQSCVLGVLNGPAEWHSDDAKALISVAF